MRCPLRPHDRVRAKLIAEKTNKDGWRATCEHNGSTLAGHIVNTADVPASWSAGDRAALAVAAEPAFSTKCARGGTTLRSMMEVE